MFVYSVSLDTPYGRESKGIFQNVENAKEYAISLLGEIEVFPDEYDDFIIYTGKVNGHWWDAIVTKMPLL